MRFNHGVALLILTTGATLWGADNPTQSFRVPDPEEIFEAYSEGFIEYQDYLELLEITRSDFLTAEDSAYLRQFPDLLVGFSSNPLFNPLDTVESMASEIQHDSGHWRQSFLFRQYARFDQDDDRKRLYRLRGEYAHLEYYGELENEYYGPYRWGRRSLSIEFPSDSGTGQRVVFGSFKERFGLGLIYGYHGQLLSKDPERNDIDRFLFPNYGGGNGLLIISENAAGKFKLLYDTDRNESQAKHVGGFSLPFSSSAIHFEISALHGQLRTANNIVLKSVSIGSLYLRRKRKGIQAEGELAAAERDGNIYPGAAIKMRWRRRNIRINADGWYYHTNYPAWFSGGPSSKRSRTLHLEEIGLSYSDRCSGEAGLIVGTSHPLAEQLTFRSAFEYARREIDDDRIEARIGLGRRLGEGYSAKIDCYWRSDRLYSDERKQRRVQFEIVKKGDGIRTRLVLGHRNDSFSRRKDFLVMAESCFISRRGTLALLCKLDKLKPNDIQDRYLYLTAGYETQLGRYFRSYIKYTYRYDRSQTDPIYRVIRLDLGWVIE